MGLWDRLFGRQGTQEAEQTSQSQADSHLDGWVPMEKYLPVPEEERELVGVIATALAAGDRPDSQFKVKDIQVRNPEYVEVALIASALAAGQGQDVELRVKSILKKEK